MGPMPHGPMTQGLAPRPILSNSKKSKGGYSVVEWDGSMGTAKSEVRNRNRKNQE